MASNCWETGRSLLRRISGLVNRRPWIWLIYAIPLLIGIGIRLYLATRSADQLLPYLIDDGFFHLQVAKHIALGHGPTFDGLHLTNGFHPLWVWMLAGLYWVFPDLHGSFFTASTVTQVLLNLGSSYFVWRLACFLSPRFSMRWMALVLYLLNPFVIFYTITGMETSLYLFLLSLLMWQIVRTLESSRPSYLSIGIISAGMFLARTESLILFVFIFTALLLPSKARKRHALELILPVVAAMGLWMGWSWSTVHSLTQINAYAPALGKRLLYGLPITPQSLYEVFFMIKFGAWTLVYAVMDYSALLGLRVPIVAVTGLMVMLVSLSKKQAEDQGWLRRALMWWAIPATGFFLIFFANTFIRWYSREYYILPWVILGILFLVIACEGMTRLRLPGRGAVQALVVISALISFIGLYQDTYRWSVARGSGGSGNTAVRAAAQWINQHAAPEAKVASFKVSGVLSYWSEHEVQNLDGKINNVVFPYLASGRAWEYLRENNIQYLVEPEGKLDSRRGFFAAEPFDGKIERVYQVNEETLGYAPAMNMDIYRIIRY